jgi:hypothetical protein
MKEVKMQMYKVIFNAHQTNIIDHGEVIVCASNQDHATEILSHNLLLPISKTMFETHRVKGNFYQLNRREIIKKEQKSNKTRVEPDKKAIFNLSVNVEIKARTEMQAWLMLSEYIKERIGVAKPIENLNIVSIDMQASRVEFEPKKPAIEKQAIYKEHVFFSGGSARGK